MSEPPAPVGSTATNPINSTTARCCQPPYCHTEVTFVVTMIDMQAFACVTHLAAVQALMNNRVSTTKLAVPVMTPTPADL